MTSDMPKPDIESSIWIDRSTKDIWNFLSDVSVDTRWRNGVPMQNGFQILRMGLVQQDCTLLKELVTGHGE